MTKTFRFIKTVFTLLLTLGLAITLVACKKDKVEPPLVEPPLVEPDLPNEDNVEDELPEDTDNVEDNEPTHILIAGTELVKGVFKLVEIDTTNLTKIVISIEDESNYDVPVNINNFKVDGESVEFTGLTGTSYLYDHEFLIGDLVAKGSPINTHNNGGTTDIRLHTQHKDVRQVNYIEIDVTNVNTFSFEFAITTNAVTYLDNLRVDFIK